MDCYKIELTLPEVLSREYIMLIPEQKSVINRLILKGVVSSYTVAYDRSKIWMVIRGESISTVKKVLEMLPIFKFVSCSIYEIAVHKIVSQTQIHHLSMN